MKFALVVPRVGEAIEANLKTVARMTREAAAEGADLVLFPEAVLTGLRNNDDPAHDLPLGQRIPGPATERLGALAAEQAVWLGLGLLERHEDALYDAAVLLSPAGELVLKYRRASAGWHGRSADPTVYRHGVTIPVVGTPLGTFAFLLCGDLFDDYLVEHVRSLEPAWLLLPIARSFDDNTCDQARWDGTEMAQYAEQVRRVGVTTLMVNYLSDDGSFGGAWVIAGDGRLAAQHPLGQPGILYGEIDTEGGE